MITWTDRKGFIEMAAHAVAAGDPWEMIMEELPKYAVPYKRSKLPVMGPNQKSYIMAEVIKRAQEIGGWI